MRAPSRYAASCPLATADRNLLGEMPKTRAAARIESSSDCRTSVTRGRLPRADPLADRFLSDPRPPAHARGPSALLPGLSSHRLAGTNLPSNPSRFGTALAIRAMSRGERRSESAERRPPHLGVSPCVWCASCCPRTRRIRRGEQPPNCLSPLAFPYEHLMAIQIQMRIGIEIQTQMRTGIETPSSAHCSVPRYGGRPERRSIR